MRNQLLRDRQKSASSAPRCRTWKLLFALPYPEQPALDAMQALKPRFGNEHELADLHSRLLIRGDHVRLDDAGHPGLEFHLGQRSGRAAPRTEHGRKITAAEAVHQVVVDGESGVLDDARCVDGLL